MQYQDRNTQKQDNKNLYTFIGIIVAFFLVILGAIIYYFISQLSSNSTISDYIDVEYDPISGEDYSIINQEQQGDNPDIKYQYLGFGPLYEKLGNYYYDFIKSTDNYISESFEDPNIIKYVSLLPDSIQKNGDTYTFTIYFNSESPVNVTLITKPDFTIDYSS